MSRRWLGLCLAAIAAIVLITYLPAMRLNFYADDYSFVEIAGRSTLPQYLTFYFDPRAQTGWYRPLQGMLFGIEWVLFGANPIGYHVVNVIVHLANCLLLFVLTRRLTHKPRLALIAALIYAGLPLHNVAVFWPGDADFLLTLFYLLALYFWIAYLRPETVFPVSRFSFLAARPTLYVLAFVFFLCALLTKEFGVTLPIVLFLADRLLMRAPVERAALIQRYMPFALAGLAYAPLEIYIQSRSVLTNMYGYGIGAHTVPNFIQYLAWLAFPWGLPEPVNYVWLGIVALAVLFVVVVQRHYALLFLGIAATLAFLPVINFPWFFTRYLYLSVMASAIILAWWFDLAWARFYARPWFARGVLLIIAIIILGNSLGVSENAATFAELGRQTRVPFRDISQRHSVFPNDTYLYFVDPPTITSQLSGMFFLRYGAGISVSSDEHGGQRANLREHDSAWVIWFDEQRRTREIPVDRQMQIVLQPRLPVDFAVPLRLVELEMPSAQAKRGEAFVVIMRWQASARIEKSYTVSVRVLDAAGRVIAQDTAAPRRGTRPTLTWTPGELIVDARVLLLAGDTPATNNLRLEICVNNPETGQTVEPLLNLQSLSIVE